jgi:phosphatidylserine/phosphatidylglycerophosphate/cardiolipin synthase-like enzyme
MAIGSTLPAPRESYTPKTLLAEIQDNIALPNPIAMKSLLSTQAAAQLNQDQKKSLYEQALETKKEIDQWVVGTNIEISYFSGNTESVNSSQKALSLYSTQQKNLVEIINLLYTFKFLPALTFPQALFTHPPYKNVLNRQNLDEALKSLIANEQEKIYVCCFHITLRSVANSLVNAKNNGIAIDIIIDQEQLHKDLAAINIIRENKIAVLAPQNDKFEHMHHKFFIFKKNILNKSLVWTGSYNPTPNANERSWDDVVILDNPTIIEEYIKRFEEVKNRSK